MGSFFVGAPMSGLVAYSKAGNGVDNNVNMADAFRYSAGRKHWLHKRFEQ